MGEARARRWANELMQPATRAHGADELTVEDELPGRYGRAADLPAH
jgi:hypothetical protein